MSFDLSTAHHPLTDVFASADHDAFTLSSEQLAFYRQNGYVAVVPVLDAAQLAVLRDELAELTRPGHEGAELWYEYHSNESDDPDAVLFHALGAWRLRPALHDLLWHAAITVPARQLLAGGVRFWHDQLFCKPARHGGVVAWHQDYSYWTRTKPMNHLTCWIGLDESTTENGCVHYVPGSHQWPLLPTTQLANDMEAIRNVLSPDQLAAFRPVPIEMPAGYASFHHPLTLHGSYANHSERPRRAVVLNFFADGTRSDQAEPLLAGTTPVAPGTPMVGQFHPLLLDAVDP
ncbi:phytanoyl-CoA dioxygenase family protein [Botrimarina hoheduenensis]|uniref:Phytanoyl-CoA dioxygenase (PhyH) n=1 Tax=Botrimarina hoheduenensis TaxID=2528000 RepID=A0A5C5VZ81_9BACT|nr:phytanoyl-CoA dioxygenase family protein [Botrimarina hoheduenensis]TWT43283.1 Phytanoyl-CoA dioxygenase (PhyH) [Botrimarina hoheduenensis]